MRRSQSLRTKLPLAIGALLLVIIGALSVSTYVAVRDTATLAGTTRLQSVTQQLAGSVRTNSMSGAAALQTIAENPEVIAFLRDPSERRRPAVTAALSRRVSAPSVFATELRDLAGTSIAIGRLADPRLANVDDADVVQFIARRDTSDVGSLRAIGDSVVFPTFARVFDGGAVRGYIVRWHRQTSTPRGRQSVVDLIGPSSELFIGDTSQVFWTDLVRPVAGPPVRVPVGTDISLPTIARYDRNGTARYAAAAQANGTPWVVLVEFPESVVMAPAEKFLTQLRVLAGILAAASLLTAIFLSRWLTRPLTQLAVAANAVAVGDRARRVAISRSDELGLLAKAFNRLAEGVESTHREGEARFKLLIENIKDYAIFQLDPVGRIVTWNSGAERLKGYSADEIVGQHFSVFYPPDDGGKPPTELRIATAEGRVEDEGWRVRKDGTRFWANVVITALRNDDGELVGFSKVTRDMTARREGEESLRARTKELDDALTRLRDTQERLVRREKLAILGQLSSGVGHELRNPLGVMTNAIYYLDTVLGKATPDVKEYLGILRRQVELSSKIVSDLLDFARVKPPEREPVTLADVVQQQIGRLGRLERVQIIVDIPRTLPAALADQVQVGQVIFNLLTNAVQAMEPKGGTLTIRAAFDETRLFLKVSDEGHGISLQNIDKIFEPLFTTKARGMGLGLAVSRALAVANGGDIVVESREGHGATFTVTLPTADIGKAA